MTNSRTALEASRILVRRVYNRKTNTTVASACPETRNAHDCQYMNTRVHVKSSQLVLVGDEAKP
jgi:hypothetical protein